jgi:hypothetical protein
MEDAIFRAGNLLGMNKGVMQEWAEELRFLFLLSKAVGRSV